MLCMESTFPVLSRDTARAMSDENMEIARRCFDAWTRDDLDAFLAWSSSRMARWPEFANASIPKEALEAAGLSE